MPLLHTVNTYWNGALVNDDSRKDHRWEVRKPGETACCHDYAVTKLADLIARGLLRGAMALAWCEDSRTEAYHIVLLVKCADGVYVLDSLYDERCLMSDCLYYDWRGQEAWGAPGKWEQITP